MAVIRIMQATNATLGLPSHQKVVTISEMGGGYSRFTYNNTTPPAQLPGGIPLTEQTSTGVIQVDVNGVTMDEREFADIPEAVRNQIASMVVRNALVVTLGGVVQTANAIRVFV